MHRLHCSSVPMPKVPSTRLTIAAMTNRYMPPVQQF